ncbi:hypothetical protein [Leucobacter iarius]|uniref:Tape measure domain-containing protein n=1 Tax=Leucobacter iarius TaxID=333963 RepID=A0ABN2LJN7_9MICO
MGKSLILAVKIIGDASSAVKAMDDAAGKSDAFGQRMNTAAKWAAGALVGIGVAAADCVSSASELQQAGGAVESVFGEYADTMKKYGADAADAVGLSASAYGNMASVLGAQLKGMGFEMGDAATKTNDLIGLGSDLAATYGGTTAEAVEALGSLLRGERDPIERYGVTMNEAMVKAEAMSLGLIKSSVDVSKVSAAQDRASVAQTKYNDAVAKFGAESTQAVSAHASLTSANSALEKATAGSTGEMTAQAKAQATLSLLSKQTGDAQGQFAREQDTVAGAAQKAAANFENAKAALGESLLPIVADAATKLSELAKYFQQNSEWITPLVGAFAAFAAGIVVINGAMKAWAAIQAVQTAAQWANNAAWLASPITWIILAVIAAIALLVAIIVIVIQNWDKIAEVAAAVWQSVIDWINQAARWLGDRIGEAIAAVVAWWTNLKNTAVLVWQAIIQWIQQAVGWLGERVMAPIRAVGDMFTNLRDTAVGVFQAIIDWVKNAIDWIANLASNAIPGWAKDLLGMSSFAARVQPEVAAFDMPMYSARMLVAPEVAAFSTPEYSAVAGYSAPLADTARAAGYALAFEAPRVPTPGKAEAGTTIIDNRKQEFHFPAYVGDRDELVAMIREALADDQINRDRLIHA